MGDRTANVYDYPVEEIALSESHRVLHKIVSMRALHHHKANFDKIKKNFEGIYPNLTASENEFAQVFFSYDDSSHIKKLTGGIEPK